MGEAFWKHTIRRFFDTLFHEIGGLVAINLLFLLTCLPVVTVGSALSALTRVTGELVLGCSTHPVRDFWAYFRLRLPRTIGCGLLFLGAGAILGFSAVFYLKMMQEHLLYLPLVSLSALGILALAGLGMHLFPVLTKREEPLLVLFKWAALELLGHWVGTVIAAALSGALLTALVLTFPASVPILLTVGLVMPALMGSFARSGMAGEES